VDRRSVRIRLTEKGRQIHDIVQGLYSKHTRTVERVGGISEPEFRSANAILMRLERFFSDNVKYRL
jgi:DNA-binding MarR family transcriptional regulator